MYGLPEGACTRRLDDVMPFVRELALGSVNVREIPGYRRKVAPLGRIKDSGTGVKEGVEECSRSFFTHIKTISLPW